MTAVNTVWKIRDTKTGLFWNGYRSECDHAIGTRFERRASIDDVVKRIIQKHKGFPPDWEVQVVQLSESVTRRFDYIDAFVDAQIMEKFPDLLSKRGCQYSSVHGAKLFRKMRLDGAFEQWPYIGLRKRLYASSWPQFTSTVKPLGLPKSRVKAFEGGWAHFADKDAVMIAKLADTMDQVFTVEDLRVAFAEKIGVDVDAV